VHFYIFYAIARRGQKTVQLQNNTAIKENRLPMMPDCHQQEKELKDKFHTLKCLTVLWI
jgi:hypothetical protein